MNAYDKSAELTDALVRAIKATTRGHIVVEGTILTVDETAFTASIQIGDSNSIATLFDVPLHVLTGQQASIIEIPIVGTVCMICFRDGNISRPQIFAIHKALKLLINCDNIVFNDGSLGGLVKVDDIVIHLNKIEQDINYLKSVLASWIPVPNDGGAALKTAASNWFGQQLALTQKSDIENVKIKQ